MERDIVERLRDMADDGYSICDEAADEIDGLRAKIEEMDRPLREHAEIYGRRSGGMKEMF